MSEKREDIKKLAGGIIDVQSERIKELEKAMEKSFDILCEVSVDSVQKARDVIWQGLNGIEDKKPIVIKY